MTGFDWYPFDGNSDHPGLAAAIATHGLSYAYVRASFSTVDTSRTVTLARSRAISESRARSSIAMIHRWKSPAWRSIER